MSVQAVIPMFYPKEEQYIAKLAFTILQPGYQSISLTGVDARYFNNDVQTKIQTIVHFGAIKFYLGDFTSQNNAAGGGDGKINFDDIVQFALSYFITKTAPHQVQVKI